MKTETTLLQIARGIPTRERYVGPLRRIHPQRRCRLFSSFILHPSTFLLLLLALPAMASPIVVGFDRFGETPATGVSPGLLLYNELKCAACHGTAAPLQSAFPLHQAPLLDQAGARLRLDYIQAFIADPEGVKPGTTMPAMLASLEPAARTAASEDLAHFLASLGGPLPEDGVATTEADREAGAALFHSLGCVACHAPSEPAHAAGPQDVFFEDTVETPEIAIASVPLPDLAAKTTPEALAAFLLDPATVRPGGRMPNMTLTDEEARQLAHWLITGATQADSTKAPASNVTIDPVKVARGKELFQSMGCASCHALGGVIAPPAATPLAGKGLTESGCLATSPVPGTPWFNLNDAQRGALRTIDAADSSQPTDTDVINHTLLALNCYACHDRDGLGGPEPGRALYFTETEELDLGDEGRLPPALTGVGAKLTPEWLTAILTDGGRVRPYMATRMPHFGEANVERLAAALLAADADPNPPAVNVSGLEHHHRNMYGRELMGTGGLGCVTCHDLNGHKSLGIPAVDLAYVPARLQPAWFMKYMLNPTSLRPQTRMPAFFEKGKSLSSELFKGDAVKQIEALWIYLKEVNETRLPDGMEDTGGFELIPTDQPLVHRTFMKDVGTRAIAVGFPGGLNYAFDAETCRVALVWRGRFIDAESAWADRFTPFVSPLGEEIAKLPEGPAVALNAEGPWKHGDLRFTGYRLDESRTPIFCYQLGTVAIEESLRPSPDGEKTFMRRLTFKGASQTVYFRLGSEPQDFHGTGDGIRVIFTDPDTVPPGDIPYFTTGFRLGDVRIEIPLPRPVEIGSEESGYALPVEVTEAGTTIEEVLSW